MLLRNGFVSPKAATQREKNANYKGCNSDMIKVINELNRVIKEFYKQMKSILHNDNCVDVNVKNVFDNIDVVMKSFILNVKQCFVKLKQVNNESKSNNEAIGGGDMNMKDNCSLAISPLRVGGLSTPHKRNFVRMCSPSFRSDHNSKASTNNDSNSLDTARKILNIVKEYNSTKDECKQCITCDTIIKELTLLLKCILGDSSSASFNPHSKNKQHKITVNGVSHTPHIKSPEKTTQQLRKQTLSPTKPLPNPCTHVILADKKYNKLHYYLLTSKHASRVCLSYDECVWYAAHEIEPNLNLYNKFVSEEQHELETQRHFLRRLEQKEEELSKLKHMYESGVVSRNNNNRTAELSNNVIQHKLFELNYISKDSNKTSNTVVPIEKYRDVINELNKAYQKYDETVHIIDKLQQQNKLIPKATGVYDDSEFIDKDELMDIPDCSNEQLLQVKSLLQLLSLELQLTPKTEKVMTDLLRIVGFSQQEIAHMVLGPKKFKHK